MKAIELSQKISISTRQSVPDLGAFERTPCVAFVSARRVDFLQESFAATHRTEGAIVFERVRRGETGASSAPKRS
jgi:hypothetical protein